MSTHLKWGTGKDTGKTNEFIGVTYRAVDEGYFQECG